MVRISILSRYGMVKIRGAGYLIWHAKHYIVHILLGLFWAKVVAGAWHEDFSRWMWISIAGCLLPDLDHFIYFFTYGRRDPYTQAIVGYLKKHQWRVLVSFIEKGHKHNTNLMFHNIHTLFALMVFSSICFAYDWKTGFVLSGAMLTHYLFDISEDIFLLGYVNPNWKRFGRQKTVKN